MQLRCFLSDLGSTVLLCQKRKKGFHFLKLILNYLNFSRMMTRTKFLPEAKKMPYGNGKMVILILQESAIKLEAVNATYAPIKELWLE